MELAMVGLGRMGLHMATRLLRGNHRVIAYDLFETAVQKAEASGAEGARSLKEMKERLSRPRSVWVSIFTKHFQRRHPKRQCSSR
ncbi:MAG: hypothetical protein DRG87_00290 [Deltaproteobacteria bacterium]|nr:hypothetical protein [Deltaproteobacteria bacterium]MBW2078248.1 hypothetical protein [Deltaproteobacteria bacterium]RLB32202.1 MAG: hypothetical protein DRG87_00290 [Deltaproteobacteria bacterium]